METTAPSLSTPEALSDPFPVYARLRSRSPVYWCDSVGGWILTRSADVEKLANDGRLSADATSAFFAKLPAVDRKQLARLEEFFSNWMVFTDPPFHSYLREILMPAFCPRAVEECRSTLNNRAEQLAAECSGDTFSPLDSFARPFACEAAYTMLAVSPNEYSRIIAWSDAFIGFLGSTAPDLDKGLEAQTALEQFLDYTRNTIGSRISQTPQFSVLRTMEPMEPMKFAAIFAQLLTGSYDPVINCLALGIFKLLKDPEQLKALLTSQLSWMQAVEETIRYTTPFRYIPRVALEPILLENQTIKRGDRVLLMLAAANRDPAVFENPDRYDVRRRPRRHFGFGVGAHYCLGATLARMQLEAGLSVFLREFSSYSPSSEELKFEGLFGSSMPMNYLIEKNKGVTLYDAATRFSPR